LTGWLAKEHWCFAGSKINYIEFFWADYFRNLVKAGKLMPYPDYDITQAKDKEKLKQYIATIKAANLCHLASAKKTSGYCVTAQACVKQNEQEEAVFRAI
jgi:hypothetical protein